MRQMEEVHKELQADKESTLRQVISVARVSSYCVLALPDAALAHCRFLVQNVG